MTVRWSLKVGLRTDLQYFDTVGYQGTGYKTNPSLGLSFILGPLARLPGAACGSPRLGGQGSGGRDSSGAGGGGRWWGAVGR